MTVVDRDLAIDNYITHARRQFPRMVISRPVRDSLFIKHYDVGVKALTQQPAIGNSQSSRCQRTARANREWEGDQLFLVDIFPQLSRKGAILARVPGRAV